MILNLPQKDLKSVRSKHVKTPQMQSFLQSNCNLWPGADVVRQCPTFTWCFNPSCWCGLPTQFAGWMLHIIVFTREGSVYIVPVADGVFFFLFSFCGVWIWMYMCVLYATYDCTEDYNDSSSNNSIIKKFSREIICFHASFNVLLCSERHGNANAIASPIFAPCPVSHHMQSHSPASRTASCTYNIVALSYRYHGTSADWLRNTRVFSILTFFTTLLLDPLWVLEY